MHNRNRYTRACVAILHLLVAYLTFAEANEAQHVREYFFVGGQYVNTSSGTVLQNQMYVERLSPAEISQKYPVVILHGGGQDGTVRAHLLRRSAVHGADSLLQNFLNKPDGGRGWASWFLEKGYQVYIADETARGRSPWNPMGGFSTFIISAETISARFTATQSSTLWPQAKLHTQWPGVSMR